MLKSTNNQNEEYEEGLIVGEKLEQAKKDSFAMQCLTYSYPQGINLTNNYMLVVGVSNYDVALNYSRLVSQAGDIDPSGFQTTINIVFLDKNYNVIGNLLDKKAVIEEINLPPVENEKDLTVKNIAYLIGFEDTNGDGILDSNDNKDLFISDLIGKNLTKVTENVDIDYFYFRNENSQILIGYKTREKMKEEYKKLKFAIYDIESKKLKQLDSLNVNLDKLEKGIIR